MTIEREDLLAELRIVSRKLDGVMKLVGAGMPRAFKYKDAAFQLGMGLTELKEMIRLGLIETVTYKPGGHPRIPLSEILRLTAVTPKPAEKSRAKPTRQKRTEPSAPSSGAATREALKNL